ncbi:hypothetical protein KUV65_06740 [Maritalea mobilis]|uniref:hypothetical protein n=1 Tax=Maritalea mobilis TaxID=483324 RepID=UPI001C9787A0|nr:hypothetical protein [Maritalea mobilis]MBY6201051.1 hypothetical protein [Maritalea mobilis]
MFLIVHKGNLNVKSLLYVEHGSCTDFCVRALNEGGSAFFFFFSWPCSDDFESSEFRDFCAACYRTHRLRPTLTVDGLFALFSVAAEARHTTYDALAAKMDAPYPSVAVLAAQISEGRGRRRGLRLLKRLPGSDRRQILLGTTKLGGAITRRFACAGSNQIDRTAVQNRLRDSLLPALSVAREHAPNLTLSTFCVLLFIAEHGADFGGKGQAANLISKSTGIVNLPKHFSILAGGNTEKPGLGLIKIEQHSLDRRIVLPRLTDKGVSVVASIAAALRSKEPAPMRFPKAEKLREADCPEDVKGFGKEDFDEKRI